ncbi:hypothetical protein [Thioalkalivibrio sulfidiphilus]|uniref:Uncharacterized protein n=1 Tax=Thioalkalivibrio sulfidiphilus (strain HL-EbGR7) TaxID=396588 RepID=B8GNE9_THISH|nr:hypothetical protein [Thioalkalivibrio sulfidiphilus]ACL73840.1 conserved hypothetical protein [Thioalkalivibrio sulfidiphilus HL-EbGr7]
MSQHTSTPPLSEQAIVVEGTAHNGKPCRVVDNTGTLDRGDLAALLDELIEARRFGLSGLSATGGSTIRLGEPEFTHIQMGENLYRLILFPYEARLEAF